ncbi:sensor histidine kinase N-terminal domain-containing protein [Polaromonas sp.]|uniref:sensor histidine kinase n=1 Tax=Polaromonas sp. TaxID=1869339 RepID=UPI0032669BC0
MRWKKAESLNLSLRLRLFLSLLPVLAIVTSAELWMTHHDALDAANAAYDRSLLGAAKSISANISTASGGLSVELPYRQFEFFELTASDQVHFRIASSDGLVEIGSADLPPPPTALKVGAPVFYDANYFGEAVRVVAYLAALEHPLAQSPARDVLIQVAEGVQSRHEFTRRFVARAALRDGFIFALNLLCVAFVVALAVRPLARLASQVRSRRTDDLTPLDGTGLPAEVDPLVQAVNQQMQRTKDLSLQQREFVDDASHQLRTHLTTLQLQADYAIGEDDPALVRQALSALRLEIARATHTTNQLLTLARSDTVALNPQNFELAALVRDVALNRMPQARAKGIDLGVQHAVPTAVATGDLDLLREALLNLVANAVSFTPSGGEITIASAADDLGWSLSVTDSGPGISDAEKDLLGHRFVRTHTHGTGSGLGLAIARAIAERHGGVMKLDHRTNGPGLQASIWWPRPLQ